MKTLTITKPLRTILLLISAATLAGCATTENGSGVLPSGGKTMSQIYNQPLDYGSGVHNAVGFRSKLPQAERASPPHYPMIAGLDIQGYSSMIENNEGAPRLLPNPTIAIYVYPHFDGSDQDYVPAHKAYIKLYQKTHFALPGERAE